MGATDNESSHQELSPQESDNTKNVPAKKIEIKSSQEPSLNQKAFLDLKEQADKGLTDAQFEIGCFYEQEKMFYSRTNQPFTTSN